METAVWITAIATLVLAIGILFTAIQARAAHKSIKAQVLMKLIEEWRDPDIYRSIVYVHSLRQEWKKAGPPENWYRFAQEWVVLHAGRKSNSPDERERELWNEWHARRTASQFMARMGMLIHHGYLTPDEFFQVVPETGRLLVVLWPIEKAIERFWTDMESQSVGEWDRPFPKWELSVLWFAYKLWYHSQARECALSDFDLTVDSGRATNIQRK